MLNISKLISEQGCIANLKWRCIVMMMPVDPAQCIRIMNKIIQLHSKSFVQNAAAIF